MMQLQQNYGATAFLKQLFLLAYLVFKTLRPPPNKSSQSFS